MVNRKTVSALTIAAMLACAVPVRSITTSWAVPLLGQATPSFPVPTSVEEGTEVTISSGSDDMKTISETLQKGFEADYANSKVVIETKDDASAALQDVLSGNVELAAISRPLTAEEKAQGLIEVPIRREKIAVVVDKDNPFSQSLTGSQFAQIFRGEIQDWAAVGGPAGPIKLVDRPAASETRQALRPYPVFTTAPFNAAAGATTLEADTTEALVEALGNDGIGYVLVGELEGQPELKALQLHKTPPSDPKYPFSQPYSFVYAGGASPAVSAFLGYAAGNPGQAAVNDAGISGLGLIPDATNGGATADADPAASAEGAGETDTAADANGTQSNNADPADVIPDVDDGTITTQEGLIAGPDGELGTADDINVAGPDGILGTADDLRLAGLDGVLGTPDDIDIAGPDGVLGTADDVDLAGPDGVFGTADDLEIEIENDVVDDLGVSRELSSQGRWWWLLLPLAGLGLLIWAAGRRGKEEDIDYVAKVDKTSRTDRVGKQNTALTNRGSRADLGETETDLPKDTNKGAGSSLGKSSLGNAAVGGAAVVGGTAAATGIRSRITRKASDADTAPQSDSFGEVNDSIDGVTGAAERIKGSAASDIDGVRSNIRADADSVREASTSAGGTIGAGSTAIAGAASNLRTKVQGSIDSSKGGIQGSIEGVSGASADFGDKAKSSVEPVKENIKNSQDEGGSWLDRAKQRINEATEQAKEAASDLKDDVTGKG